MSRSLNWLGGALVVAAALLSGCGGGGGSGSESTAATAPAQQQQQQPLPFGLVSTNPVPGAIGVPLNTAVTVTIIGTVDAATVNGSTFRLTALGGALGGGPVAGVIGVSGNTATFTPITPLDPSTQHIATITTGARDVTGAGLSADFSWTFTTVSVPGAPTIGTATAGDSQANVTFTPPVSNGGAAITSYTATSNPSGITATGAASPITVTGLVNGTPYTFTVAATNSVGNGPPSGPSNSVTPNLGATVPGAPTALTATAGNGQASVTFGAAPGGGPGPVLSYTVTALIGGVPTGISATGGGTPIVVPGLANGTAYTFTAVAFNSTGPGPASAPSNAVTPAGLPGAPTAAGATAGNTQATVTFSAPASNGGSAITGYTVTSNPSGITASSVGAVPAPIIVPGLLNGTPYTFTVTATNSVGTGPPSAPSNPATPAPAVTVPGAPTSVIAAGGNAQATVSFAAPASDGGSAVISYTVTSSPGGITATGGGTMIVVPGLTNGIAYTFTVRATNSVGTGAASLPSAPVTPATVPGAPIGASATAGNTQATVTFSAPAGNGGSAIIGYTVTSNPAGGVDTNAGSTSLSHAVTGLLNGVAYTFTVTAANSVGTGAPSAPTAVVTPTAGAVPGAPTGAIATAGNAQATVVFSAPASSGGSAISGYTVTSNPPGGVDTNAGTTGLSHVVTGLTNGTTYTFTVTATNLGGNSPPSAASNAIIPATTPGAPTAVSAIAGNTQATVSFTPPASNGGAAIVNYTVTSNSGITAFGAASPITYPAGSLTNGTSHTFTVTASNSVGTGPASLPSSSVTPNPSLTVPPAPTAVIATAGNTQASVTFTAPACVLLLPLQTCPAISGFTVTSNPPGGVDPNAGSLTAPRTITGLTNGTAYTFTVTATNSVGTGPASGASNTVTPATVPGAPTLVSATAGNLQATVNFLPPASNGGSAIIDYTVTVCSPACAAGPTGTASPIVVTGLTNNLPAGYTFTVTARNAIGTGAPSAASNNVTPSPTATVPGPPTGASAVAGNGQATVTFTAPISTGGSAITGYTVTSNPSGITASLAGAVPAPVVVPGLTNGTAYTFTVTATNSIGTGPSSGASNTVTPATTPGAPTAVTATAGNAQATVAFTPPASNGGSPITGYTVTARIGGVSTGIIATGAASPIVVLGLTNTPPTAYTFIVTANNSVGTGPASLDSNPVTPTSATVPGAPTGATATGGNAQATVTFTAGATGGSAITGYTATSNPGGFTASSVGAVPAPIIVTGLSNGTAFTFTVTATNAVGLSAPSAASNSVTPAGAPGAPTAVNAVAGNAQATVSFTPPASNGGSAITSFTVTSSPGNIVQSGASSPITVSTLTNGTPYTFTVTASNGVPATSVPSAPSNSVIPTALATACSPTVPVVAGALSLRAQASRVTGVSPLSVHFDATATTSSATSKPFHEIEYRWQFRQGEDPALNVWTTGSRANVSSRILATGPIAGHVYDLAPADFTPAGTATRTVILEAFDGTNTATCSMQIIVTDPDHASSPFASTSGRTLCVSSSGNFAGCPPLATQLTSSDFPTAINSFANAGRGANFKRILFRRGESFISSTVANIDASGPGHVGAFGTGARPIIVGASTMLSIGPNFGSGSTIGASDWRFVDLDFDGVNRTGTGVITPSAGGSRITFLRSLFRNVYIGFNLGSVGLDAINVSSQLAPVFAEWAFVDLVISSPASYGFLGFMNRAMFLGNQFTSQTFHSLRLDFTQKAVISNNELNGTANGSALTVRGVPMNPALRFPGTGNQFTIPANTFIEQVVISDNRLFGGGATLPFTVRATLDTEDTRLRNFIVERNWATADSATGALLQSEAGLITIRNNLWDLSAAGTRPAVELRKNAGPTGDDVAIKNNSVFSSTASSVDVFVMVDINGNNPANGVVVRNNLGSAPNNTNSGTVVLRNFGGASVTQSNNSTSVQIRGASPLTTTPPTTILHWQPAPATYPVDTGTAVPVWSDFGRNAPGTTRDLGAWASP